MRGKWIHRPMLGPHGSKFVAVACTYEAVSLVPGCPLPSITEITQKYFKPLGVILCVVGLHHFYIEDPRYFE